jgi:CDP-diacylglycerol--serine O-phosphatidyltransferase
LRCAASGALQREHRGGGQTLLPGPAVACGCGAGGGLYLADDRTGRAAGEDSWLSWSQITWIMFGFTLYAGLTMVTNVPFYSFKDVQMKKSVPFAAIVLIALGLPSSISIPPSCCLAFLFCMA